MNKEYISKVDKKTAKLCRIDEYYNSNIVLYSNDRKHCYNKHAQDFKNTKVFGYIMNNLTMIIEECDFVFYNSKNKSLEYYKKIEDNVTVRVKVEPGNELRIKTVFPISDVDYNDKKSRAIYNKYVINN